MPGNFSWAMLSMLQIMCFDSWSSQIARNVVFSDKTSPIPPIFFVSYVLVSGLIMMNVVLAILLDKFLSTSQEIQAELKAEKAAAAQKKAGENEMPDPPNQAVSAT